MDFQVISTRALNELAEIAEFVARDNPEYAFALCDGLVTHAKSLRYFPLRYPKSKQRLVIRKMPAPPYHIYFSVNERTRSVQIIHFWHSARQPPFL